MPYYDAPLKDSKEYQEGVAETEAARKDDSLLILELEYMVHFKKFPCLEDYLEGPQYESVAYLHSGKMAVLREAIKRNISCAELLGFDVSSDGEDIPEDQMQKIKFGLQILKSRQLSLGT